MASFKGPHSADFFKKDPISACSADVSSLDLESEESASSSEDEGSDGDDNFHDEDRIVAKLYRKVVDEIMVTHKLKEANVNRAISKMKNDIHVGHKNGFRRFEIDFCAAANRCGYLRRYAACHTGLVKKAIWQFFSRKMQADVRTVFDADHLKVASLGGGPGSDLVGFCSALQEARLGIKHLDLTLVDISQGWMSVFPSILRVAFHSDFGTLSGLLRKTKVTTGFLVANLNLEDSYDDGTFSSVLESADVVLMVKVLSFVSHQAAEAIIQKVADSMSVGSLLIFIDQPYDDGVFRRTSSLRSVYHRHLKYELSFRPSQYHCPAIDSSQASVGVFLKELESTSESDSSDSDAFQS